MIQIKCFEEEHESDLEEEINEFLCSLQEEQLIDVKVSTSHFLAETEQIYSFFACVVYRIESEKQEKLSSRRKMR